MAQADNQSNGIDGYSAFTESPLATLGRHFAAVSTSSSSSSSSLTSSQVLSSGAAYNSAAGVKMSSGSFQDSVASPVTDVGYDDIKRSKIKHKNQHQHQQPYHHPYATIQSPELTPTSPTILSPSSATSATSAAAAMGTTSRKKNVANDVLQQALNLANKAVEYDRENKYSDALEAYQSAVKLLSDAIKYTVSRQQQRASSQSHSQSQSQSQSKSPTQVSPPSGSAAVAPRKKCSADEETKRLRVIHDTYAERIELLEAEIQEEEARQAAVAATPTPVSPAAFKSMKQYNTYMSENSSVSTAPKSYSSSSFSSNSKSIRNFVYGNDSSGSVSATIVSSLDNNSNASAHYRNNRSIDSTATSAPHTSSAIPARSAAPTSSPPPVTLVSASSIANGTLAQRRGKPSKDLSSQIAQQLDNIDRQREQEQCADEHARDLDMLPPRPNSAEPSSRALKLASSIGTGSIIQQTKPSERRPPLSSTQSSPPAPSPSNFEDSTFPSSSAASSLSSSFSKQPRGQTFQPPIPASRRPSLRSVFGNGPASASSTNSFMRSSPNLLTQGIILGSYNHSKMSPSSLSSSSSPPNLGTLSSAEISPSSQTVFSPAVAAFHQRNSGSQSATSTIGSHKKNSSQMLPVLKPYHMLRALNASILGGAYISPKIYMPSEAWSDPHSQVKIPAFETKIRMLEMLTSGLQSMRDASQTKDHIALSKAVEDLETLSEDVQNTIAKKLGRPFVEVGAKARTSSGWGVKVTVWAGSRLGAVSGKGNELATYAEAITRLATAAQVMDPYINDLVAQALPAMSVPSPCTTPTPSQLHMFASPPQLYDYPPQLKVMIEARITKISAFLGTVVCRWVSRDVAVILERLIKKGGSWVVD